MAPRSTLEDPSFSYDQSCEFSLPKSALPPTTALPTTNGLSRWSSSSPIPEKKAVAFLEQVRVRRYIHINDFTQEEVQRCWYTHHEFGSIKLEIRETVHHVGAGGNLCTRGLEFYLQSTKATRKHNKRLARCIVLDEQELQVHEGVYDSDYISQIYIAASQEACIQSRAKGLQDELDAMMLP